MQLRDPSGGTERAGLARWPLVACAVAAVGDWLLSAFCPNAGTPNVAAPVSARAVVSISLFMIRTPAGIPNPLCARRRTKAIVVIMASGFIHTFYSRLPCRFPPMRSIRLFADTPLQPGLGVALPDSAAAHAVRVLRLRTGDMVTLFNGDGHEYPARLAAADAREVRAEITSRESPKRESSLRITLVQALARGEKMDWIIQKAVELGAARIVPVSTERSEVKLDDARSRKRLEHWRAIATAACE